LIEDVEQGFVDFVLFQTGFKLSKKSMPIVKLSVNSFIQMI